MAGPVIVLVALVCACLMGFAIQRGATCMVAAVDEIVTQRSARRLLAMLEASAIVAAVVALASLAGKLPMDPPNFAFSAWVIAGGALLGVGAVVTRACVFGAIARLGSGEWAYALAPVGFFLGCLAANPLLHVRSSSQMAGATPLLAYAPVIVGPVLLLALFRLWLGVDAARRGELSKFLWSPHIATGVIGLTFAIMFLTVGPWAYTNALADIARGMGNSLSVRTLLLLGLFGGAVAGGWTAGRLKAVRPTLPSVLRCLVGGALMGAGSVLVPGSNDGLILIGLPLLQPYAWAALASMTLSIFVALQLQRHSITIARKLELA